MLIDLMFKPSIDRLLECYCEQLQQVSEPVAECCLRPGDQVAYGLSLTQDECCSGLGWLRLARVAAGFPSDEDPITRCAPLQWRLELELGSARCAPTGSAEVLPTCAQWSTVHELLLEDFMAMRRAVICCFNDGENLISIGEYAPFGAEGGCVGGTLGITIEVLACNECD